MAEALDVSQRLDGLPVERAMGILEPPFEGALAPVPLDMTVARRAAYIRDDHYHRAHRPVSLADAVLLASAAPGARIATADPDVIAMAQALGIGTVELPGQR